MSLQSRLKDRVYETTTTQGTGAISLAGAVTGARTFSSAYANGDRVYYAITVESSGAFETGLGTYNTSGNTLSRDTVFSSSSSNVAVNWGAGTKNVFATLPAAVTPTLAETLTTDNVGDVMVLGANGTLTALGDSLTLETLTVDTIVEATSGTGVTIDGVLLKDGGLSATGTASIAGVTTLSASLNLAKAASVASAATTNIWATDGNTLHVTGTTTITSLGTAPQAGATRTVIFDDALTLTHGANVILPSAANITTAVGDVAVFVADTTTQIKCAAYIRYDGKAIAAPTKAEVGLGNVLNLDQSNASNLTSGTVATARLGSGTADSTSFLRGDGTWANAGTSYGYGVVGSYICAGQVSSATDRSPGTLVSGSILKASNAAGSVSGSTLSGTWLIMGYLAAGSTTTLLRIA